MSWIDTETAIEDSTSITAAEARQLRLFLDETELQSCLTMAYRKIREAVIAHHTSIVVSLVTQTEQMRAKVTAKLLSDGYAVTEDVANPKRLQVSW
jgi:hypothetical protein